MRLELADGQAFALNVVRYEFPDEELGLTEDNPADDFERGRFLIVTISCKTPEGDWHATAPEMTTTELDRLAVWLETVANNQPSGNGVYFTERDLEFNVDEARETLNVHLFRDFVPSWAKDSHVALNFPIAQINMAQAISSIGSQLAQFPHRPIPN